MPTVILQRHETVLEIVLNRPEVLNAANHELAWARISAPAATSRCLAS